MSPEDWRPRAKCRDYSPRLFFREETSDQRGTDTGKDIKAKRICASCPVIRECLTEAIQVERAGSVKLDLVQTLGGPPRRFTASYTPPWGIWGGAGPEERHASRIKHYEVAYWRLDKKNHPLLRCAQDPKCKGCRPVEERVDLLLEKQGVKA